MMTTRKGHFARYTGRIVLDAWDSPLQDTVVDEADAETSNFWIERKVSVLRSNQATLVLLVTFGTIDITLRYLSIYRSR